MGLETLYLQVLKVLQHRPHRLGSVTTAPGFRVKHVGDARVRLGRNHGRLYGSDSLFARKNDPVEPVFFAIR